MRYDQQTTNLILAAGRCARGLGHSCVDSIHLLMALSEEPGKLGLILRGAGLDVWFEEPTANHDLYSHPAVSCTPHIGAQTVEAQKRIGAEVVEIISGFAF